MPLRMRPVLLLTFCSLIFAAAPSLGDPTIPPPPLRTLIVGGGPDAYDNQVAIESNVRYVERLLPADGPLRVLFTSGNRNDANVLYQIPGHGEKYRPTLLAHIDGPSHLDSFQSEFSWISHVGTGPMLLYFTGHGSPDDGDYVNNQYDMWDGQALTVRGLARKLDTLPADTRVVLIMVECFSGAFGNVLFDRGDPKGAAIDLDVCGFFASVPQRAAAGCTPEINQKNYKDFTSYFFAALTGHDRMGGSVTGADYDGNGVVGMNEAYAYALIHDESIDTPVCTSDVFLRRFVTTPDSDVFGTSYSDTLSWADPAQQAVLTALSADLGLRGENRLATAYSRFRKIDIDDDSLETADLIRFVRMSKTVVLAHQLATTGDPVVKARYDKLIAAESRNPLIAAPALASAISH